MSAEAKAYIDKWADRNVQNEPLADGDRFDKHIHGLWNSCVIEASQAGFALPAIEDSVGDLEDYLRERFEKIFDPTAGLIKD
jgi:hypothetical protein